MEWEFDLDVVRKSSVCKIYNLLCFADFISFYKPYIFFLVEFGILTLLLHLWSSKVGYGLEVMSCEDFANFGITRVVEDSKECWNIYLSLKMRIRDAFVLRKHIVTAITTCSHCKKSHHIVWPWIFQNQILVFINSEANDTVWTRFLEPLHDLKLLLTRIHHVTCDHETRQKECQRKKLFHFNFYYNQIHISF